MSWTVDLSIQISSFLLRNALTERAIIKGLCGCMLSDKPRRYSRSIHENIFKAPLVNLPLRFKGMNSLKRFSYGSASTSPTKVITLVALLADGKVHCNEFFFVLPLPYVACWCTHTLTDNGITPGRHHDDGQKSSHFRFNQACKRVTRHTWRQTRFGAGKGDNIFHHQLFRVHRNFFFIYLSLAIRFNDNSWFKIPEDSSRFMMIII